MLTASTGTTYQWYKNGQKIAGATNQTLTVSDNGIYVVRITDALSCFKVYSAGFKYTSGSIGVKVVANQTDVQIYPNPSTGEFFFSPELVNQLSSVQVYDMQGKLAYQELNPAFNMQLSNLDNGIYVVSFTLKNNQIVNKKITINK